MCVALYINQSSFLLGKEGNILTEEEMSIVQNKIGEYVVSMLTTFAQNPKLKCPAR
jgi:hypothetical protein